MKIICTQAEKEWIIDALSASPVCPLRNNLCGKRKCIECTEESIEWEVTDGDR